MHAGCACAQKQLIISLMSQQAAWTLDQLDTGWWTEPLATVFTKEVSNCYRSPQLLQAVITNPLGSSWLCVNQFLSIALIHIPGEETAIPEAVPTPELTNLYIGRILRNF